MRPTLITLAAAATLAAVLIPAVPAAASSPPPGTTVIGWDNGHRAYCLGTRRDVLTPGTPVLLLRCNPDHTGQQWVVSGGTVSLGGMGLAVSPSQFLELSTTGADWAYGPGHELSTSVDGVTEWATWCVGWRTASGRRPWTGQKPRCGAWYEFTSG